jgi:hypothetical protein
MLQRSSRPREAKRIRQSQVSTIEDKLRRHRNKERIWRRAVAKLAAVEIQAA